MGAAEMCKLLRFGIPVTLVNLSAYLMQIVDLAVVGHLLGAPSLTAVCLVLVFINLTQEPACFITANAMTTLCADLFYKQRFSHVGTHVRAAVLFALLLTVPFAAFFWSTPRILALFTLDADVLDAAQAYAPWTVLATTPALLLSSVLGLLRAQGKMKSTAVVSCVAVGTNLALALFLVPKFGLAGSALSTAATRYLAVIVLAIYHRQSFHLSASPLTDPAPNPPSSAETLEPDAPTVGSGLGALFRQYAFSLLPATMRIGVAQVLTLFALQLCSDSIHAAAISLVTLLLQTTLSMCMGVQQATLMLTSRYLSLGRRGTIPAPRAPMAARAPPPACHARALRRARPAAPPAPPSLSTPRLTRSAPRPQV